jgi:transposase
MFKPFYRNQDFLLPPSLGEMIPAGDLVYLVAEVVDLLDLSPLYRKYDSLGQNAYHPGMLLGVLFYAYSQGVFYSRRIAERLRFDVRFMYLSGMQYPDFRTIADFRKDNNDLLQKYFTEIVRLCMEAGMVSLNHIAIDGTKVKASASKKRMKERDALAAQLAEVEAEIARLLEHAQSVDRSEEEDDSPHHPNSPLGTQLNDIQQIRDKLREAKSKLDADPNQKQVNLTDPDSRVQDRQGPGYNCQIAVDNANQVIVAADVVSDPNDTAQLIPMVEQAEANTQSQGQPKNLEGDAGYGTGANHIALQELPHINAYVPPQNQHLQKGMPEPPYDKYSFAFDPDTLECFCPQGHPMKLRSKRIVRGVQQYGFQGTKCPDCPVRGLCTKAKYRKISLTQADHLLKAMRVKLDTLQGREAMRIRRTTVEPVFGQLKKHLGFREFSLRGLSKVKGEFALLAAAHNLKKLHKFLGNKNISEALALAKPLFIKIHTLVKQFSILIEYYESILTKKPRFSLQCQFGERL